MGLLGFDLDELVAYGDLLFVLAEDALDGYGFLAENETFVLVDNTFTSVVYVVEFQ